MNVISIDFSKVRTGIFTKIDGRASSLSIENKAKISNEKALVNVYQAFTVILDNQKYNFGLIEGYAFNFRRPSGISVMAEIAGVIKLSFAERKIPLITIPVQVWKSLTISNIDKTKNPDLYFAEIKKKYGMDFVIEDEADAFLIYQATREVAKKTKRLTPAVKKIKERLQKIIEKGNKA